MAIGRVKWFSATKGYGFVTTPEVEGDVFVHFSVIVMAGYKTLEENAEVEFELTTTRKGYMARLVRPCDEALPTIVEQVSCDPQMAIT